MSDLTPDERDDVDLALERMRAELLMFIELGWTGAPVPFIVHTLLDMAGVIGHDFVLQRPQAQAAVLKDLDLLKLLFVQSDGGRPQ